MSPNQLNSSADLEKAFKEWNALLFRYVFVRLRDIRAAEDVVQEAFIKAWINRVTFDAEKASLKTWLFAITSNTLKDHLRREQRRPLDELEDDVSSGESVAVAVSTDDQVQFVFMKMAELSDKEGELLMLRYREDLDIKDIAKMLNMKYSATKVAIHRAMKKLKDICNQEEE